MKVFVIDVDMCVGCYACQFVCKDEHVGNDWSPIAKPQPDTGQFWMQARRAHPRHRAQGRDALRPDALHALRRGSLHPACPIEGAIYKREDGLVIIDSDKCTGCRNCVDACPYDAIYFNDDLNLAQKCTGCAHLLDGGEWKIPRCADACPTEAIKFGEESDFADLIAKAEVLKPETRRQAAGVLPQHPEEVRRRHRLRPGRQGGRRRRDLHAHRSRRRQPARPPPTASATSGSAAWPTAPATR